jgi:hypothetical protein
MGQNRLGGIPHPQTDNFCPRMGRRVFPPPFGNFRKKVSGFDIGNTGIPFH